MKTAYRKFFLKRIYIIILIFTLSSSVHAATAKDKTLKIRTLGDPLTLDWNRAFTPVEATLIRNIMEGLIGIDPHGKLEPALAQSWHVSSDLMTYTFALRPGVRWSDGTPLNAQHFLDSWERLLSPNFRANYAYVLFDVENAQEYASGAIKDFAKVGIKTIDSNTLQVKLKKPVAYWPWILTFWSTFPIRKDLIQSRPADWDKPKTLVSIGPYTYDTYEPHQKIILKRNSKYYGKTGNIARIEARLIDDEKKAVDLYLKNQIDFMTRLSIETASLSKRKDLIQWPEARVVHLDFNFDDPLASKLDFRKAVALAIDKSLFVKKLNTASQAATTLVSPGILSHSPQTHLNYQPQLAQSLLKKLTLPESPPTEVDLVIASFKDDVIAAEIIQSELKKNLNLVVRIRKLEPKQFYSPLVKLGGFTMILNRWTADYPDPDNFYSIFLSNAGNNRVGWRNGNYDSIVRTARSETSERSREQLYYRAHQILVDEHAIAVPLYYGKNIALIRPTISGFIPTPTNSYLFKYFSIK